MRFENLVNQKNNQRGINPSFSISFTCVVRDKVLPVDNTDHLCLKHA